MASESENGNEHVRLNHEGCGHVALEVAVRRTRPSFPTIELEVGLLNENRFFNHFVQIEQTITVYSIVLPRSLARPHYIMSYRIE